MKRMLTTALLFMAHYVFCQNVGIGTINPLARLHVADSSVLFTAVSPLPLTPKDPPVSGSGNRMMWYADKAAFRAGATNNIDWNKANIGNYSLAIGYLNRASGEASVALGQQTQATSISATAIGYNSLVTGNFGTAIGIDAYASGARSVALGNNTIAEGDNSVAAGNFVSSKAWGSFVTGSHNDQEDWPNISLPAATDRIFQIGNGIDYLSRSNALTILRNGNMGIGNLAPSNKLSVNGNANFTGNVGIGNASPVKPLSFPALLGEKILLYPGANGEVGIGVYGNELRLHGDNPGAKVSFGTQTNTGVFTEAGKFEIANGYALTVFGNIWANGVTYNSDARFKKNIVPLKNSLEKIIKLSAVQYEMMADEFPSKNFKKGEDIGLLAQEVEAIIPQVVATNADGYKSVDYAKLVPLLIEGMKEQQKQIEALKQEINKLKEK